MTHASSISKVRQHEVRFLKTPDRIAGLLLLWAAIWLLAFWGVLLLAATPPDIPVWKSAAGQLHYIFVGGNPHKVWHVWMAALPLLCVVLSVAYLNGAGRKEGIGWIMFGIVLTIAISACVLNDWTIAVVLVLPVYWAYGAAKLSNKQE